MFLNSTQHKNGIRPVENNKSIKGVNLESFLQSLTPYIKRMPSGNDRKLLRGILEEAHFRFGGYNLFEESIVSMAGLSTDEALFIIDKTIGRNKKEDIFKISEKLKKYQYHDYYCPDLFLRFLGVEDKIRRFREFYLPILSFVTKDHKHNFNKVCEEIFLEKQLFITSLMGIEMEFKKQSYYAFEKFKKMMVDMVWNDYSNMIEKFSKSLHLSKTDPVINIAKFENIKMQYEGRLYRDETIREIYRRYSQRGNYEKAA